MKAHAHVHILACVYRDIRTHACIHVVVLFSFVHTHVYWTGSAHAVSKLYMPRYTSYMSVYTVCVHAPKMCILDLDKIDANVAPLDASLHVHTCTGDTHMDAHGMASVCDCEVVICSGEHQ